MSGKIDLHFWEAEEIDFVCLQLWKKADLKRRKKNSIIIKISQVIPSIPSIFNWRYKKHNLSVPEIAMKLWASGEGIDKPVGERKGRVTFKILSILKIF